MCLTTESTTSGDKKTDSQSNNKKLTNDPLKKRKRKITEDDLSQLDQVSWSRYIQSFM